MREMIPLEEARALVCGAVEKLPVETVELLDAVGRVVAADQISDIDVSPFAHSAMDGFALRAGLHCAPSVHQWLGTLHTGACRASVGIYNTETDVEALAAAVGRLLGPDRA